MAHGYRNNNGDLIVRFTDTKPEKLGSVDDSVTLDEAEEIYVDTDGSLSKAAAINKTLVELDRKVQGEDFDTEHSTHLNKTLAGIVKAVNKLNDSKVKITPEQLGKASRGTFNTRTGEITVRVDEGKYSSFRNQFTMSNQEIYVHEMVHAATEFIFSDEITAGKDPSTVGLINSVKTLYKTAKKNTKSWEDLLPGYTDGKPYTLHEQEQAKQKYDYIFNSPHGTGLEEFMSHLLTNKLFRDAMSNVNALDKTEIDEDMGIVDRILAGFKNFIAKLSGFVTHTKDESITDAGADLLMKIMKAQSDNADKAINSHPVAFAEKVAEYVNDKMTDLDETLKPVVDKLISSTSNEVTEKVAEEVKGMTKVEKSTAAVEAVQSLMAKQDKESKRQSKILKFRAKGKDGKMKAVKNSLVNSISLLSSLYNYAISMGDLRRAKELDPEGYAKAMKHFHVVIRKIEENVVASILRDFMTKDATYNMVTDAILALTQAVDKLREGTYEEVLAETRDWFGKIPINNDAYKAQNAAINDVVLRTDIQSLGLDSKGLQELLSNPSKVEAEVVKLKAKVNKLGNKDMVEDALSLATYMVTGVGLTTNAENIASGFGRQDRSLRTDALVEAIDQLAAYEALRITDPAAKKTLVDFMTGVGYENFSESKLKELGYKYKLTGGKHMTEEEYTKQVEDGVNSFLGYARGTQLKSKEELKHNQHNVIKGYMKETFDTGTEVVFKPVRDRKELEDKGYKYQRLTKSLPGTTTQYAMFTRVDGKNKRTNGALGLQSVKARGFTLLDKINEESEGANGLDSYAKKAKFAKVMDKAIAEYNVDRSSYDMQPIYNDHGDIVNFRVTMSHEEKSKYLDMEARGTQNLARTHGTFGTAEATFEHNKKVLKGLKDDADKNYKKDPTAYVVIRPRSMMDASAYGIDGTPKDEDMTKYEQYWARLPKTTHEAATDLYGKSQIIIRRDLLLPAFGEDDVSLAESKLANTFGQKVRTNSRMIERYWQDAMQIAKSNIVIKVPAVLVGNVVSNAKILGYVGVNPVKGAKLLTLGYRELKRYEADTKELHHLERAQYTIKDPASAEYTTNSRRIAELREDTSTNLVAPLINAGMFQSIVEDVSTKKETNRVSNFSNKMLDKYIPNETANTAMQYLFMTEKTKPFQAMLKATQVSDFYFRFAQYHDAIDNKGKTPAEALRDVTDDYINYEAPLNKWVRYGDKMGTWFFVRYFVGIQRVIKKILKKHPGRVGAELATEFMLGDIDGIEDQSILVKGLNTYNFDILGHIMDVLTPPGAEIAADFI